MESISILGTGMYAPPFVATNDDFTGIVETSDEWIRTRTGMERRHISEDEPAWYMGALAAQKALDDAGLAAEEIDMIICTSVSLDYATPSGASFVQRHIGAKNAFAMDINVACAGSVYALDMARRYLSTGDVAHVLIVAAEALSQITNYEDRTTCVLLGDAAGACIVGAGEGMYGAFLKSDASGIEHLYCKRSRRDTPFFKAKEQSEHDFFEAKWVDSLFMNGREVYKFAVKAIPEAVLAACERAKVAFEKISLIVPHQANLRILETAAKNLGVGMDKMFTNIAEYANASSATVMVALDECAKSGRIKRGDLICCVGFGAGLAYGACVFEY